MAKPYSNDRVSVRRLWSSKLTETLRSAGKPAVPLTSPSATLPGRKIWRIVSDTCALSGDTSRLKLVRKAADGTPDCDPEPRFPLN